MQTNDSKQIGILLTNIGSPEHPTPVSVRQYLKKFLSDPRVVEIPKLFWLPILYGFILPFRSKSSAKLYQQIWSEHGAPLVYYTEQVTKKLAQQINLPVEMAMHYSQPTIKSALEKLRAQQIKKILVLPLYPQYSGTTTAASFDQVMSVLNKWRAVPEVRTIHEYATNENYITALANSIKKYPVEYLLFSFHGIPNRYVDKGDPYPEQCYDTALLVAEKLKLPKDKWSIAYQSRIGRAKWLMPYTNQFLSELPKRGVTNLHVVCPGFAVDCLETLEEIAIRGKEEFLSAGGKSFQYIPALNDSEEHINLLKNLVEQHIQGW